MDQSALIPCPVFVSGNFDSQLLVGCTGRIRKQYQVLIISSRVVLGYTGLTDGLNQPLLPVSFTYMLFLDLGSRNRRDAFPLHSCGC